jgi:hypothetical protein
MKLSQVPNFRVEDFQSEQSWIGRLFINLNPFIQAVNQVFENNVDFSTNIKSVTKDYDITSFQEFSFSWPFANVTPVDLRIVKAAKGTSLTPAILLAAWEYSATNSTISVTQMVEVTSSGSQALSGRYQFSVRVTV